MSERSDIVTDSAFSERCRGTRARHRGDPQVPLAIGCDHIDDITRVMTGNRSTYWRLVREPTSAWVRIGRQHERELLRGALVVEILQHDARAERDDGARSLVNAASNR